MAGRWEPFSRWHLDPPDDEEPEKHEYWEDDVPDHWWASEPPEELSDAVEVIAQRGIGHER